MSQKNKMLVLYSVVRNYLDTIQEKKFSNLKSFGLLVCTVSRNFRNIRKVSCLCRYVENLNICLKNILRTLCSNARNRIGLAIK